MPLAVFLRAANVGSHQRFQPAILARQLAHLGIVNIGAAGTFFTRNRVTVTRLRAAIQQRLPFTAELMICDTRDLVTLAGKLPPRAPRNRLVRHCVSVMARVPRRPRILPIAAPRGRDWQVKVVLVHGRLAFCEWRRRPEQPFVDPNRVIEQAFGVRATTRNWNTIEKIRALLSDDA